MDETPEEVGEHLAQQTSARLGANLAESLRNIEFVRRIEKQVQAQWKPQLRVIQGGRVDG
jgi:hypothetical protein